ncbi:DUF2514 family protein [Pseudomonas sp. Irchel s3a18]|uniref:DUF2514 family protein n=1 Tax=Pseudomonas sp. Irchel s3a18 TaxID=2009053 RepID=UPI0021147FA3|nr:DUF2514 family protein [Pseudomonas sp. Irchel s3a18]
MTGRFKLCGRRYRAGSYRRRHALLRDHHAQGSRRLSASQSSGHSCTAAASQAATRAVLVLADVLKRADQRAGDLAATADQASSRGVICEHSYDVVSKAN